MKDPFIIKAIAVTASLYCLVLIYAYFLLVIKPNQDAKANRRAATKKEIDRILDEADPFHATEISERSNN